MTTHLTFTDSAIIKFKNAAFMTGLAFTGSSIVLTNLFSYSGTSLSYIGCILVLQSIALFPFRKDRTKRNWSSLISLSLMLFLCLVLLFIHHGNYLPIAIALLLLNICIIKKEIQ